MSKTKRILCVDDDADTCELVKVWLRLAPDDYDLTTTAKGSEALEKIRTNSFDLIVLDSWLGETSGVEVCDNIRRSDQITPIMFFSAVAEKRFIEEAIAAGADEYLTKPSDDETFVALVDHLCERGRGRPEANPTANRASYA